MGVRVDPIHRGKHMHRGKLRVLRLPAAAHRPSRGNGPRVHSCVRDGIPRRRTPARNQLIVDSDADELRHS